MMVIRKCGRQWANLASLPRIRPPPTEERIGQRDIVILTEMSLIDSVAATVLMNRQTSSDSTLSEGMVTKCRG